ncbi:RING/FYVE/PHD zinc finger superfamily protein [Perilla frutescens var. hirtella]|uniref:RING/FYVE/PHD zinc finger superfamily protein n=1 Tax=Perilla frutescens var. hirtella TaxID=608512 RepID=A0AAD4IZN7_PERFH|nr:RING/FYVE/PHD zinc finger superfamily protein [Perilla frutescens var. frutescens]KAH6824085.1 RING/FYVE/PHD zinc finger superfamily protein [Perilla frutescens var. hirtella]
MCPKSDIWPKSFQTAEPNDDNIALYFFPSKISEQVFEQLVGEMIHEELAFRAIVQDAELLIFTSTELPLLYWTFRSKYYLWGVFRGNQPSPSNALSSKGEVAEIPKM